MTPTKKEEAAIAELKKLAQKWPKSLWLFSASGTLCVMRCGPDGGQVTTPGGGMDQSYILDTIKIPNDGGDW
jgi:hypothetical protein